MPRRDSRPLRRRFAAPAATVAMAMAPGSQTPRWFRSVAAWAALTGLLAAAAPATALQVLDARDGVAVEAVLSIKEPTRIRIDGAAITDVFGNIHSSNCGPAAPSSSGSSGAPPAAALPAVNPAGEIVLDCDRDKGEIYIRPVGDSPKPVNLFISSAHATYTLVLRKADTPADTIVIRDPGQRALQAMQSLPSAAGSQSPLVTAPNHIRGLKTLLLAMASDRVPPDIRVDELNQPIQLWAEARFSLMRRYEGRGLVGEKYLLQNVSQAMMVLAEQEFDRPDTPAGGQVLAVAVEHHNLRPGETTNVFVIRRGGQ